MINKAKWRSNCSSQKYIFGYQIPRTPREATQLDAKNRNTKWQDAMTLETMQLNEYKTFQDLGKTRKTPDRYKQINVHFIFAINMMDVTRLA